MLGWMHPGSDSGHFVFSELASYVAGERLDSPLILESIYSIVFPNPHVENRGGHTIRPFSQILKMMRLLGGLICRDELIVSVLAMTDDREPDISPTKAEAISRIRGKRQRLVDALSNVADSLQENTLKNYTRFPLGILKSTGWAESVNQKGLYERSIKVYRLTAAGEKLADLLNTKIDVRHSDLANFSESERAAFVLLSQYEQFGRGGFDLEPVREHYPRLLQMCRPILLKFNQHSLDNILYAPFQQSPSLDLDLAKKLDESFGGQ
jgi:hypothetical protein